MFFVAFRIPTHAFFVIFLLVVDNIFAKSISYGSMDDVTVLEIDDISKGVYSFRFITPENIIREENGHLDDEGNIVVEGFYTYADPDGNIHFVSYHADKEGYRAKEGPLEQKIAPVPKTDLSIVASLLG